MKRFLLFLCLLAMAISVRAASLVEGRVYLKNGLVIDCTGPDRLQLPKKSGTLKIFRNAFRKTKVKTVFQAEEIDSVVCWNARAPEHIRKFIPSRNPGWMWVYFEIPYIRVCVYSRKGYGLAVNGGILVWQRHRLLSKSRSAYYLQKQGNTEFHDIGGTSRRSKDIFRERIARYIHDDPVLAERILRSKVNRSKTVLMLRDYYPAQQQK